MRISLLSQIQSSSLSFLLLLLVAVFPLIILAAPATATSTYNSNMTVYIVVFRPNTTESVIQASIDKVEKEGGKITQRYSSVMLGYAAEVPDKLKGTLESHEGVDFVEEDQTVSINPPVQLNDTNAELH